MAEIAALLRSPAGPARLSPSSARVYGYMREFFLRNDQLPPMESIRQQMGWASANAVTFHLKAIETAGLIERNEVGKYRFRRGQ